jgi:hypothetical protein
MANLTKAQRASEEKIKQAIMNGYQRGVCDSYGRSIRNEHGKPMKMPRFRGAVTFHKVFPRRDYRN